VIEPSIRAARIAATRVARRPPATTNSVTLANAMGGSRGAIVRTMLGQAMVPVIVGASTGLAGGWLLTRTISAYLYEASAIDPGSVITATMFLLVAAAAVSWLPLMKATAIDPMVALRDE
jgi:ABC-type antimicrobial peptide transport system permease subunit